LEIIHSIMISVQESRDRNLPEAFVHQSLRVFGQICVRTQSDKDCSWSRQRISACTFDEATIAKLYLLLMH